MCFITNEVMATGSGTSIIFTDISTTKETHYRADGETYGDGVSCLAGHKNLQIFAFSEMCVIPRIFVLSYPHFNKIAELKRKYFQNETFLHLFSNIENFQVKNQRVIFVWNFPKQNIYLHCLVCRNITWKCGVGVQDVF